MITRC